MRVTERDVALPARGSGHLTMHLHIYQDEEGGACGGVEGDARGRDGGTTTSEPREEARRPRLVLCVHGAGYSGLTFAPMAEALLSRCRGEGRGGRVVVVAPDLRGHGASRVENEREEWDLSIGTLVEDLEALFEADLGARYGEVVLVGWSMGAAVAIKAASKDGGALATRVVGLVAIDVVEGTAMEALKSMAGILAVRPKGFESMEEAVEWAVSSGTVRRRESAEISVPGMLVAAAAADKRQKTTREAGDAEEGEGEEEKKPKNNVASMRPPPPIPRYPTIAEDGNGNEPGNETGNQTGNKNGNGNKHELRGVVDTTRRSRYKYVWRVSLERTEKYWTGWFQGLSQAFLNVGAPKLLLLAGHDRLDKTLTIAQMQGKFQMAVVPHAGHAIHEDQPKVVADTLWAFLQRHLGEDARREIGGPLHPQTNT